MTYEIDDDMAYIYEKSLMYGEHTWGLANQHFVPGQVANDWYKNYVSGLTPNYARMVESWKEHASYIEDAERRLRPKVSPSASPLHKRGTPTGRLWGNLSNM